MIPMIQPKNKTKTDRWNVVGIDGCRGGWAIAHWAFGGSEPLTYATTVHTDLGAIVEQVRSGQIDVAAVDMPMGLFDKGTRPADTAARAYLSPRGSTLFSAPARCTLDADSYEQACELSRAAIGKALSVQAFNLMPKIRELDALVSPDDQNSIVEAHPECSFARVANGPLLDSKHTAEGRSIRLQLLVSQLGHAFAEHWDKRPTGVSPIDLLDAWSLALSARRVAEGRAEWFGDDSVDPTGKSARIWF